MRARIHRCTLALAAAMAVTGLSSFAANAISAKVIETTAPPKRGTILEENFDERDLHRAYEEVKNEYLEKAFGNDTAWKLLATLNPNKKKNDDDDETIKVSIMEHPSDPLCPYVKMETILPIPVKDCWDFLSLDKWDETMPKMDPFYEGLDIYGDYSLTEEDEENIIRMILARKRTKRILTFGKREFVFVSVEDKPLEDGTWVSGTVSVQINESTRDAPCLLLRNKSYTRAFQDSIAFYKPVSSSETETEVDVHCGRTKLTILCRIDLNDSSGSGGCIPMWLYVKTIGITGVRSVLNMRQCLLEAQDQR